MPRHSHSWRTFPWPVCRTALTIGLALLLFSVTPSHRPASAQEGATTDVHVVAWGETLFSISLRYGVPVDQIAAANGIEGDRIYAGQRLVIPGAAALAGAPGRNAGTHVVQPGETLYRIGLLYNVTAQELAAANGLSDAGRISAGQTLVIPAPGSGAEPAARSPVHTVQPGETLFGISLRYGVALDALAAANNLLNPSAIFAGQQLAIPGAPTSTSPQGYTPSASASSYTVQPGDTLTSIAARHGTAAWVLAQVNSISNPSLLYVGQTLTIPAPGALSSSGPASASQKAIVVDVSDQRAYVYEGGQLLWTFVVSTGIPGADTFRGNFQIQNKIPNAYASTWDLQMPYWLGFYWAGPLQNGFHALPILSNGVRLWEGLLGRPASYGCVILSDQDAQALYNWAEIGTPVTVRD